MAISRSAQLATGSGTNRTNYSYLHSRPGVCPMRSAILAILILSAAFLPAQEAKVEDIGKSPTEAKFVSNGKVRMDLCSSGMEVVGKDSDVLRVEYDSNR